MIEANMNCRTCLPIYLPCLSARPIGTARLLMLLVLAIPALLLSCGGEAGEDNVEDIPLGHLIKGEISGGEGQDVTLLVFQDGEQSVVDSTVIKDGTFEIYTKTKDLRQYIVMIGNREIPLVLFLDNEAENVTITGSIPGIGENYQVSGSVASQEIIDYMAFLAPTYPRHQELRALWEVTPPMDSTTRGEIMVKLDSISAIRRDYAIEKIMSDSTSPTNWVLLRDLIPESGIKNFDSTDLRYFQTVANGLRMKYPKSEYPTMIESDLASIQGQIAALNNPQPEYAPGEFEYAPEIAMNDYNGKPISLSSLRGNVVLIDFWASWCGPCRMENPNVVKAYGKWKDKGFTVYSVSLDDDKAAWMKAITDDNLFWPNHVSDLKGWTAKAADAYGVRAIPATWLIDADGKVIGRNLRGVELEQKLQEVLG